MASCSKTTISEWKILSGINLHYLTVCNQAQRNNRKSRSDLFLSSWNDHFTKKSPTKPNKPQKPNQIKLNQEHIQQFLKNIVWYRTVKKCIHYYVLITLIWGNNAGKDKKLELCCGDDFFYFLLALPLTQRTFTFFKCGDFYSTWRRCTNPTVVLIQWGDWFLEV